MKSLFLISMLSVFTSSSQKEEKCYYFCIARPIKTNVPLRTVLYSDIKDTVCSRAAIHVLSMKWADFVKNRCGSSKDCTSEFNYYTTKELAEKNLHNAISKYENFYQLEKVVF